MGTPEAKEPLLHEARSSVRSPESLPTLHIDEAPSSKSWATWHPAALLLWAVLRPAGQCVMTLFLRGARLLLLPLATALRWRRPHRPLPPIEDPLLQRSATQLARLIRSQQVSSEEVVSAFAARVRAVQPHLNAVVEERFAAALEEARAADAEAAAAQGDPQRLALLASRRPLLGVPLTVKESVAVKGLSHTAGQLRARGRRAARDAEAVARLRAAGAVPLLVSACPELCMFYETFTPGGGTARNPHDTRRTPGGSSGGEAALLGAGASVIGVGSDIGGSLRLPAMFCGVYGHKPTAGAVSLVGHLPDSDDVDWWRFFIVGPMTRYAEDLNLMMKLMSKDNIRPLLRLDEKVDVKDLRIFYIEDNGLHNPVDYEILTTMHSAIDHLKSICKVPPKKIHLKELLYSMQLTTTCLFRLEGVNSAFQEGDDPHVWKSVALEWLKYLVGLSQSSLYALVYGPLRYLYAHLTKEQLSHYIEMIGKLRGQLQEILKDDGVLLYPTFSRPAVFHRDMFFLFPAGSYCTIFNFLQMPATNCPIGKTRNNLPIGIQIAAAQYQDRLTFAVAQELENALGGWIKP